MNRDATPAGRHDPTAAYLLALLHNPELVPPPFQPTEHQPDTPNHARARHRALLALQYAGGNPLTPATLDLLRRLTEQLVHKHETSPFQGLSESLRLALWLLASRGGLADVWLRWRAKTANGDAETGLAWEAVQGPDVDATVAFVRAAEHPDRERLLADIVEDDGEPCTDQEEVDLFFAWASTEYPGSLAEEPDEVQRDVRRWFAEP